MDDKHKRAKDGLPPREKLRPLMISPEKWVELERLAASFGQTVGEYLKEQERRFPNFTRLHVYSLNHPTEKTVKELKAEKKFKKAEEKRIKRIEEEELEEKKTAREILEQQAGEELRQEEIRETGKDPNEWQDGQGG